MIPLDSFVGQSADGKMVPIILVEIVSHSRFLIGKNMWRGPLNIDFGNGPTGERKHFEGVHMRGLRFFWLQIGAVWFLLNFGVWVQRLLVNLYLYFSPIQRLSGHISGSALYSEPWVSLDWPVFGWEAKPPSSLQNLPSHSALFLSLLRLHILLPPGPVSCSAQSGSMWMSPWRPALWSHEGLFPPGLWNLSCHLEIPQAIHTSEL